MTARPNSRRGSPTTRPPWPAARRPGTGSSALQERFRGTASLAAERARHLSAEAEETRAGRDPAEMEAEAVQVRVTRRPGCRRRSTSSQAALTEVVARAPGLERRLADAERALVAAARAVADRREGLAKLAGQVNALRTRASAGGDEIARLSAAATGARERAARAAAELEQVQAEVGTLDEGELGLDERHEQAVAAAPSAAERGRESWRTASARPSASARPGRPAREALALGLTSKDGVARAAGRGFAAARRARLGGRAADRRRRLRGGTRRRPRRGRRTPSRWPRRRRGPRAGVAQGR